MMDKMSIEKSAVVLVKSFSIAGKTKKHRVSYYDTVITIPSVTVS